MESLFSGDFVRFHEGCYCCFLFPKFEVTKSTRLRNSPLKAESFVEHQLKLVISSILERVQVGYHMLSQGLGEIAHIDPNFLTGTSKFYPQREKIPTKESIRTFTDEFKKEYDRLDIVCNNAGVMGFLVLQKGISQKVVLLLLLLLLLFWA